MFVKDIYIYIYEKEENKQFKEREKSKKVISIVNPKAKNFSKN